jgi:hypothetical protein
MDQFDVYESGNYLPYPDPPIQKRTELLVLINYLKLAP